MTFDGTGHWEDHHKGEEATRESQIPPGGSQVGAGNAFAPKTPTRHRMTLSPRDALVLRRAIKPRKGWRP